MENQGIPRSVVFVLLGVILLVIFGSNIFINIDAGEKGVLFKRFDGGLDHENLYDQGFHIVAPWNYVEKYNVKKQTLTETIDVLDSMAQPLKIEVNVRFHPDPDKIGYLHQEFGQDYVTSLVKQEMGATARRVMSDYEAEEIYSTKRKEVEDRIIRETREVLSNNFVVLQTLLVKSITLSDYLQEKIDVKLGYKQEKEAYVERLELEDEEIERKKKEAEGIYEFTRMTGFTADQYLQFLGIQATQAIATSTNSKFVISSGGELPVLLQAND